MANEQVNMEIWSQVEVTPKKHSVPFKKGGFTGTSVNPIINAEKATKLFGPAGQGWGVKSLQTQIQRLDDETVMISEEVELWYIWNEKRGAVSHWSSEFIMQRVNKTNPDGGYIKHDDEAWKKCRTNATSKCFSLLGFSADLWKGYYESAAYVQQRAVEDQREDTAMKLRDKYRAIVQTLDDKCLCRTEADRTAICRWVLEDPEFTLGAMQVTPGLSEKVKDAMSEIHDSGVQSFKMLEKARDWNKAILGDDAA